MIAEIFNYFLFVSFVPKQIEETSTEVTNRRSKVSFSPKDIDEVVRDHLLFLNFAETFINS